MSLTYRVTLLCLSPTGLSFHCMSLSYRLTQCHTLICHFIMCHCHTVTLSCLSPTVTKACLSVPPVSLSYISRMSLPFILWSSFHHVSLSFPYMSCTVTHWSLSSPLCCCHTFSQLPPSFILWSSILYVSLSYRMTSSCISPTDHTVSLLVQHMPLSYTLVQSGILMPITCCASGLSIHHVSLSYRVTCPCLSSTVTLVCQFTMCHCYTE